MLSFKFVALIVKSKAINKPHLYIKLLPKSNWIKIKIISTDCKNIFNMWKLRKGLSSIQII